MVPDASVARSVDATPALVRVFDRLFEGLESLGSFPAEVVGALARAGLHRGARVLDLGCGKGASAIELARAFDARVLGVDGCRAFVTHARRRARELGEDHVEFRVGDAAAARRARHDAAIMLGLFGVDRAAPLLRRAVRPGGLYLIDDAYSEDPRAGLPGRREIRAWITAQGDELVVERIFPRSMVAAENRRLYAVLASNALRLARESPRLARPVRAFLERQRRANRLMAGPIRCGLWVARTPGG